MNEEIIIEAAKKYEKSTGFGDIVLMAKGVNSAAGIGFLEGAVWMQNDIASKEEPVSENLEEAALLAYPIRNKENKKGTGEYDSNLPRRKAFIGGANWQREQMMKDAVEVKITDIRTYKSENEVNFTLTLEKGLVPYEIEDKVKLIIVKED